MASVRNTDDEAILQIFEGLNQIEAILKAESKRRFEANQISNDYINSYMDKLDSSLQQRVQKQFAQMEQRIAVVNDTLTSVETEFTKQETLVNDLLTKSKDEVNLKINAQDLLLRNVKQNQLVNGQKVHTKQQTLIREVQLLLQADKQHWNQIKTQIVYRLETLRKMSDVSDFAEDLKRIQQRLAKEIDSRKNDDQEIIDVLNEVCFKMSKNFS